MSIILTASYKGGCMKSTLATNLVSMRSKRKKVLLIDGDRQQSSLDFTNHRHALEIETPWTTVSLQGSAIRTQVSKLKNDYDDIIIDVGGHDGTSLRSALLVADYCITPFQPKTFDVWTASMLHDLVDEVLTMNEKLKVYALISFANSRGEDNKKAQEFLSGFKHYTLLPVTIGYRKAYPLATNLGLSVVEHNKDAKAVNEMKSLYNLLFK